MRQSVLATAIAALIVLLNAGISTSAGAAGPKTVNDGYGDFVFVPSGSFRMGDNFGDGESRERPVHVVDLDAFYIGKFEVTNGDWRKFRDDPGYDDPKFWPSGRVVPKDQVPYWNQAQNHGGGTPGSDDYPVLGVNWDSATAYCNWLSAKTGKKYRLPTEAEWEKAARGTDQRRFPWAKKYIPRIPNKPAPKTNHPDSLVA
jgi:formylglycine-generating enzyme required for sulfatase activity